MSKLHSATLTIDLNEPCLNLSEMNLRGAGGKMHRWRIITVIRNERPTDFWEDLGPSTKYKLEQFRFPGGTTQGNGKIEIVHTVAELIDAAQKFHARPEMLAFDTEPSPIVQQYYDELEEAKLIRRHQSVSGPVYKKERK